jgi:RNA polymerase sigma-70 factor, ECF subfamily
MAADSDERLHERLLGGDLAAFDALYERYERRLFGFVRAHLDDVAEAEDAFHEAFLRVLKARDLDFRAGSFRSWLYRVARNECLNRLRARGRGARALRALHDLDEQRPPPVERADERLQRREVTRALGAAVARLPSALAELYHLRSSGLSYEEMARVLEVPLGTVKSRMHELVGQLRKEMQPWTAQ